MSVVKYLLFTLVISAFILNAFGGPSSGFGSCPLSSQMTQCSPKCTEDNQCSPGTKCCPNICNSKSCSQPNQANSGSSKYGSSSSATGTYCGNQKCNSYEKCDFDKTTKRQKCVRT